jgi:HEAT repeat protein
MRTRQTILPLFFPLAAFALLSACHCVGLSPCHAFDDVIDSPMYKSPDLPVPEVVTVFPEKAKDLWLKALQRPEADVKCQVADAVALAHQRGARGFDSFIDPFIAALDQSDQHSAVRLAVARTLIALDARKAAPSLLKYARAGGGDLCEVVEPALAQWNYEPARSLWLERLRDPATPQRSLILAIQALAAIHEEKAVDRLRELALADPPKDEIGKRKGEKESSLVPPSSFLLAPSSRLEAARALAALRNEGLEKDAERLLADASTCGVTARLVAVSLLRYHKSDDAINVLQRLAEDPEPAVAAIAVVRLIEINPDLVVPTVERLLASSDSTLRSEAVEILFHRPTERHIHLLANGLDDIHREVRRKSRRLLELLAAKKEWHDPVIEETTRMLSTLQWRALEQATILLTLLDYKPSAKRLVELLRSDRPEVAVTAAWGLRRLDVPETLPAVLSYVEAAQKRTVAPGRVPDPKDLVGVTMDHQLSQLNQFLGRRKYTAADDALQRYIPRRADNSWPEARAAAIWALGLIHEGKPAADLAASLEQRLNDASSLPPENGQVRMMAAVGLGRLRAEDALPSLRRNCLEFAPSLNPVSNASGWAIEQITGEAMPLPKTIRKPRRDWFLMPLD